MKFIHYQFNILTQMYNHHHTTIFKLLPSPPKFPCAHLKGGGFSILLQNSLGIWWAILFIVKLRFVAFHQSLQLFKIKIILWFSFVLLLSDLSCRLAYYSFSQALDQILFKFFKN